MKNHIVLNNSISPFLLTLFALASLILLLPSCHKDSPPGPSTKTEPKNPKEEPIQTKTEESIKSKPKETKPVEQDGYSAIRCQEVFNWANLLDPSEASTDEIQLVIISLEDSLPPCEKLLTGAATTDTEKISTEIVFRTMKYNLELFRLYEVLQGDSEDKLCERTKTLVSLLEEMKKSMETRIAKNILDQESLQLLKQFYDAISPEHERWVSMYEGQCVPMNTEQCVSIWESWLKIKLDELPEEALFGASDFMNLRVPQCRKTLLENPELQQDMNGLALVTVVYYDIALALPVLQLEAEERFNGSLYVCKHYAELQKIRQEAETGIDKFAGEVLTPETRKALSELKERISATGT